MPEELVKPEELSKYRQVASHVVSGSFPQTWETGSSGLLPGWGRPAWSIVQGLWPPLFLTLAAKLSGFLLLPICGVPHRH